VICRCLDNSLVFISLINHPPPFPRLLFPSPLWAYYYFLWIPNQLQIIYHLMIMSVLCLCPVLFLCGVRLGSLPLVPVAGSNGGCVHWTPPFLVDLVYHILKQFDILLILKMQLPFKFLPTSIFNLLESILVLCFFKNMTWIRNHA
jgi:hypothetical protein